MSEAAREAFDTFEARWRAALEERARLILDVRPCGEMAGNHCEMGDQLSLASGLKPIGFNWELLDPEAAPDAPRSASGVIAGALSHDMEFPQQEWLGEVAALDCARDFLALFGLDATFMSNRIEDYWNPLTSARIEWAFAGFDAGRAGLMVLARD